MKEIRKSQKVVIGCLFPICESPKVVGRSPKVVDEKRKFVIQKRFCLDERRTLSI